MLNISCFTGGIAQTNGYLVRLPSGETLAVDAPHGMAAWLEKQKVKVGHLLLTHQHFDHVEDASRIQTEHGCRLFSFAEYSRELTLEDLFSMVTGSLLSVPPFQTDVLLEGQTQVEVGGITWKLQHIPGHSEDSVIFISEEHRLVFDGDVLFEGSVGRSDFPGGDGRQLIEGIGSKLLTLPDDFKVYPGHGPATTIGRERVSNPYLQG